MPVLRAPNLRFVSSYAALLLALISLGCATARPRSDLVASFADATPQPARAPAQVGVASFYHATLEGRRTASGEVYDHDLLTAAHRTLELGTRIRVTNLENSRTVFVRVNDRGPFVKGRILDLSRSAARALGFLREGTARVRVQPVT